MTAELVRSSQIPDAPSGDWPDWFPVAHAAFRSRLLDQNGYPCHFGLNGERVDRNLFATCDGASAAARLAGNLRAFEAVSRPDPGRQSLVVFAAPPPRVTSWAEDASRFWQILRAVTQFDDAPWPAGHPEDPGDPAWQWCFAGHPWFVLGCSPAYRNRRSRNVGPCLTLIFQLSDKVFEGLSAASAGGQAAKRQIRRRLLNYDSIAPHPHLGDPLASSTHRWRQFFLPDDDQILDESACPLS